MTLWTAISKSEHANSYWRGRNGFEFASKQQVIEVYAAELSRLLPNYVFGFVLNKDKFNLVAVLGFGGESNCFVTADSKWMCEIVPAAIRGFPFNLIDNEEGEKVLCIEESHLTDDSNAAPLFDESGDLAPETAEILKFLNNCDYSRTHTLAACEALTEARLIEPWPLSIKNGDSEDTLPIKGLYRISETKLNSISRTSLSKLRESAALTIAYAQLFSQNQLAQLIQRAEIVHKQKVKMESQGGLSSIFEDEDSLNFDAI
jgi:hypothetical protein